MSRDGLPRAKTLHQAGATSPTRIRPMRKTTIGRKGRVGYGRRAMISALTAASTMAKLRQGPAMSKTTASIRATGS